MQNVAKGIVRNEFPYAIGMYNYIISTELNDMLSWYIGCENNFKGILLMIYMSNT